MQTLSTYLAMVQAEADDTSTKSAIVITQSIKEAYQEIIQRAGMYLVGFTTQDIPAIIGTSIYTPSDFQDIQKVFFKSSTDTNYTKLEPININEYFDQYFNTEDGTPYKYFINGLTIQSVPAPSISGTFRIVYTPVTAELTVTSIIPDRFNNVVKNGAAYKYFAQDDNPKTTEYKTLFDEGLNNMIRELASRQEIVKPKFF